MERRGFEEVGGEHIATIAYEGRSYAVSCRVVYDGIEYVGRLWFLEDGWEDAGMPDRAALPGRTREEVIALAMRMETADLIQRYRRALAGRRRYLRLRKVTEEMLTRIRLMNQVALGQRAGLVTAEEANAEMDEAEIRLHELIGEARRNAGVEEY